MLPDLLRQHTRRRTAHTGRFVYKSAAGAFASRSRLSPRPAEREEKATDGRAPFFRDASPLIVRRGMKRDERRSSGEGRRLSTRRGRLS